MRAHFQSDSDIFGDVVTTTGTLLVTEKLGRVRKALEGEGYRESSGVVSWRFKLQFSLKVNTTRSVRCHMEKSALENGSEVPSCCSGFEITVNSFKLAKPSIRLVGKGETSILSTTSGNARSTKEAFGEDSL